MTVLFVGRFIGSAVQSRCSVQDDGRFFQTDTPADFSAGQCGLEGFRNSIAMCLTRVFLLVLFGLTGAQAGDAARPAAEKIGQQLAAFHGRQDARAVGVAWPHLDSPDRSIREAARLAIEAQPFDSWQQRALGETRTWAALEALRALVRSCPRAQAGALRPQVCEGISTLHLEGMSAEQQLAAVRLTRLVFARLGGPSADERQQMTDLWTRFVPKKNADAKAAPLFGRELRELLKFLAASP